MVNLLTHSDLAEDSYYYSVAMLIIVNKHQIVLAAVIVELQLDSELIEDIILGRLHE